jgi:alkanesulfonate monooxygenase SsuD/methylene tetrahydromethanopterin reductase-like flavin-dependent oxidoreductase (luciferase family)
MVSFGLSLPTHLSIAELVDQSFIALNSGFDYVLMPDHLYGLRGNEMMNKWQVLSVIASQVPIGVGTMVANIYREDVETLVQHVKTLKKIAKKKNIVVGLGRGTDYDTDYDMSEAPLRMEEILKKLPFDVMKIVAARGEKMKAVACDFANGWMPRHALTFEEYRAERRGVEKRCVYNSTFVYCADVPVMFNETEGIMKSLAYRKLFQDNYFFYSKMTPADKGVMDEMAVLMDYDRLRKTAVIGDVQQVVDLLMEYVVEGTDFFSVRLYDDDFGKFKEIIHAVNS